MSFRLAHDADPLPHLPVEHGRGGDGVGRWVPEMKHTFLAKYVEGTRRARRSSSSACTSICFVALAAFRSKASR